MFSLRTRSFGAVFDDIVVFFRPTYSHVREEKQRLELTREEPGDDAPSGPLAAGRVRMTIPPDYESPGAQRGRAATQDSHGTSV
jgi:hypothetical protein